MTAKRLVQGAALAAAGLLTISTAPRAGASSLAGNLTTGNSLTGPIAPAVVYGHSTGSWNLPSLIDDPFGVAVPGFANGIWTSSGFPLFAMALTVDTIPSALTEGPMGGPAGTPDSTATGTLSGELFSFPLSPLAEPFALLQGVWNAGPATGKGTFEAYVYMKPANPLLFAPLVVIGQIRGGFEDPPSSPLGPDVLGSHEGRWKLTL